MTLTLTNGVTLSQTAIKVRLLTVWLVIQQHIDG